MSLWLSKKHFFEVIGDQIRAPKKNHTSKKEKGAQHRHRQVPLKLKLDHGDRQPGPPWWNGTPMRNKAITRWWQLKYFLFSSLLGEDSHFD